MKSSKTYIISWDEEFENSMDIERQLSVSGLDYLFFNVSSYEVDSPNWRRTEDIRYYGHFYNALKDFYSTKHEVFIFHSGDVVYEDLKGYTEKVESYFSQDNTIGLFAPGFTRDAFDSDGSKLFESKKFLGLNLATMTNGMWVALSRELVEKTLLYYDWAVAKKIIRIPEMVSGWGLDIVYASIAMLSNLKIYRDAEVAFYHPPGSSYDGGRAAKDMQQVTNGFYDFAPSLGFKKQDAIAMHELILKKVQQRENYQPTLQEAYPNLNGPMEY